MPCIVTSKERKKEIIMLKIKNIDFSSTCFRKIRLKVLSGFTNQVIEIEQRVVFHSGSIEENCIDRICGKLEDWTIKNSPSERESVANIREELKSMR